MNNLDDALREAVRTLSDQGRAPEDLGPRTLAAGIRMRQRRTALTAIAAVAAALAVAAPALGINSIRGDDIATSPSPTPSASHEPGPWPSPSGNPRAPRDLPAKLVTIAGLSLAGGGDLDNAPSFVYNRAAGRYVSVPYTTVKPNFAGTHALVSEPKSPYRAGLLDLRTMRVDWNVFQDDSQMGRMYHWSPDGKKALVWTVRGTAVYDLASNRIERYLTGRASGVAWHPNSRELIASIREGEDVNAAPGPANGTSMEPGADGTTRYWEIDKDGKRIRELPAPYPYATPPAPPRTKFLQVYDLTGKPTRTIPVARQVTDPAHFSPDGRHVVGGVYLDGGPDHLLRVHDARTGKVVATLPEVNRITNSPGAGVWWADNERILVKGYDAKRGHLLYEFDLTGKQRATYPLPKHGDDYEPTFYRW